MTQAQGPVSQGQAGRPGRMTAVMQAMPAVTGPKVLRVGLVQGGRVIEERVIKQRTTVTVGASEKNTFVVMGGGAEFPTSFKLFELVGSDYYLNFVGTMKGRIALQTGPTDLQSLKGQLKPTPQGAFQVKLSDDARGKVVVGESTFLFQFVAPPPVQSKPQLPSSVKAGIVNAIDWSMTIIAAFSFLFHFGAIGTLYSDWADRVLPDEADVRGLVQAIKNLPPPPPVETPKDEDTNKPADKPTEAKAAQPAKAAAGGPASKGGASGGPKAVSASEGAAIAKQLAALDLGVVGVLGSGPAGASVLSEGNLPTGQMAGLAGADTAVGAGGPGGLKMGAGGGAVPGGGGSRSLGAVADSGSTGATTAAAQPAAVAAPKANVGGGVGSKTGNVSNADRVIAGARARARGCYQAGLNTNPDMEGRASFTLVIGPGGSVSSATVNVSGSLSGSVGSCIKAALSGLSFDSDTGGSISGSFSFVNANKK